MKKIILHLKTILIHKWWVFYYCCKCGIPWRGLVHDLSKFSPIEFFEGVKFYTPGKSPIPIAKEELGYSRAWLHHRGHNKHHCEYWVDNYRKGLTAIRMPFVYALEKICDHLAASRTYTGKENVIKNTKYWWETVGVYSKLHPDTKKFITAVFNNLIDFEKTSMKCVFNKKSLQYLYNNTLSKRGSNI